MSDRLTYKKIYIDSDYRIVSSNSTSDFIIELDSNFECPNNAKMWVSEISLPTPVFTTEKGFYERFYIMLYNGNGTTLLRCVTIDVSGKVYYASQLAYDLQQQLNEAFNDISPHMFVVNYGSSVRTAEFRLGDPNTYKFKVPTDAELASYVNDTWNRGDFDYDPF